MIAENWQHSVLLFWDWKLEGKSSVGISQLRSLLCLIGDLRTWKLYLKIGFLKTDLCKEGLGRPYKLSIPSVSRKTIFKHWFSVQTNFSAVQKESSFCSQHSLMRKGGCVLLWVALVVVMGKHMAHWESPPHSIIQSNWHKAIHRSFPPCTTPLWFSADRYMCGRCWGVGEGKAACYDEKTCSSSHCRGWSSVVQPGSTGYKPESLGQTWKDGNPDHRRKTKRLKQLPPTMCVICVLC